MLNLTRHHLGIVHESQFQGLGIRAHLGAAFASVAIYLLRGGFFSHSCHFIELFIVGPKPVKADRQLHEFGLLFFRKRLFHLVTPVFLLPLPQTQLFPVCTRRTLFIIFRGVRL
jgi:hypothetical protein